MVVGRTVGLVLAAGAGTRMGSPKALVRDAAGRPWVHLAVAALVDGGCDAVVVVLGAAAREARVLVPDRPAVRHVVAEDWARGLGASLTAGVQAVERTSSDADADADAVLVSLVDLPGLPAAAVRRVLGAPGVRASAARQATSDGRPGHPVLLGRAHWAPLLAELRAAADDPSGADRGAGAYLRSVGAERVPCDDLWDGMDQDRPSS